MKPFICMLSIFLLTSCATTGPLKQPESLLDLSGQNKIILTVHGLSCPPCSNNLDGQLQKIDGVESAVIDLKTGAVTVRLKDGHPVTAADFSRAVENAGFTLKDLRTAGDE